MLSHSPIGVFDSGLGGLTVLKSLREALPNESFIYLGDVARLPYGTKSERVVREYALRCVRFLLAAEVKHVVIACNTASAQALETLATQIPIGIHGVIDPGARAALASTRTGKLLVLATAGTVASGAYGVAARRFRRDVEVEEIACPLLVPLAEQGWLDHAITREVIRTYLAESRLTGYDTVVLGCTHYPLLEPSFRRVLGPDIALVHAGETLAAEVGDFLALRGLRNTSLVPGRVRYLATDRVLSELPFETVDL